MESMHTAVLLQAKCDGCQGAEHLCDSSCCSWTAHFYRGPFLFGRTTSRQTVVIPAWVFGAIFS